MISDPCQRMTSSGWRAAFDLLVQVGDVDVEVDLHPVPWAVVEVAEVCPLVGDDRGPHVGVTRERVRPGERSGDQLRLLLGEVHQGRQRLGEPEEEQVVEARLHHPLEQREAVVLRGQLGLVQERERDVVAGRPDDRVDLLARPSAKTTPSPSRR